MSLISSSSLPQMASIKAKQNVGPNGNGGKGDLSNAVEINFQEELAKAQSSQKTSSSSEDWLSKKPSVVEATKYAEIGQNTNNTVKIHSEIRVHGKVVASVSENGWMHTQGSGSHPEMRDGETGLSGMALAEYRSEFLQDYYQDKYGHAAIVTKYAERTGPTRTEFFDNLYR